MGVLGNEIKLNLEGTSVVIYKNKKELFADAAQMLFRTIKSNPTSNIGLPTGATYIPFYKCVASKYKSAKASFKKVTTFNLDEYVGVKHHSKYSYFTYMKKNFFSKIDIKEDNVNLPDSAAKNPIHQAASYESRLRRHRIDIQYLGIGNNGHIGFNEPGTSFASTTHMVNLSPSTIRQNSKYFPKGKMPKSAITMGIKTILRARKIVVIATGPSKAGIISQIFKEGKTEDIPATALKGMHKTTFLLDTDSSKELLKRLSSTTRLQPRISP